MKNERASIVALSYVIGFTTAFIAYAAVVEVPLYQSPAIMANVSQSASVADAAAASPVSEAPVSGSIMETVEGVEVTKDGVTRLIAVKRSFQPDFGPDAYDRLLKASNSRDGQFTFFCVTSASDSCQASIYSWEQNGIFPIRVNGEKVAYEANELNVAWASDNRLQFNSAVSVNSATPWILE